MIKYHLSSLELNDVVDRFANCFDSLRRQLMYAKITCSSSSSSNESDLGGAITLLLQDHRTTNKSVCKQPEHSKQFML